MASEVHPKVLEDVVRGILREATASGTEITARSVRAACERKLGLPADGLVSRKEELMALISCALNDLQQQSGVDAAAVLEVQNALADLDTGPTHAALLVAELTGEGTGGGDAVKAMALLAEACATSESASRRLLDAGVVGPLAMSISPEMPKAAASVALRMLSAMALHATLTEQLVRSSALPPLLSRLSVSIDGVGVQCATLVHNLADAPATRMRLLHAGTLRVLTRVIVEPAASDALKEHCLQATASLAGLPECELSFPELLGKFLSAKLPGTQRDALAALELVREKQGKAVDARLAACTPLVDGLRGAAGSSDAGVAAGAATIMTAFGL